MNAADRQIRLGMIGCGFISRAHGRASLKSKKKRIRFTACASRDKAAADTWAAEYGCGHAYTDYREMLKRESLDGVVIATWPNTHREQIEEAIRLGARFILCEKSLVCSASDAIALWDLARKHGVTIMEAFMYRHHPAIAYIDSLIAAGEIGAIDHVHGAFHMFDAEEGAADDPRRTWRNRAEAGGGVLHDFICYPVDAANKYAGSLPTAAFAYGSDSEKYQITNRLFAMISFENGCVATVESSRNACFRQSLRIGGAHGIIDLPTAWSARDDVVILKTSAPSFLVEEHERFLIESDAHDGRLVDFPVFTRQLENFSDVIMGTATPHISLDESVVNAFTLDAIGTSYKTGVPAKISFPKRFIQERRKHHAEYRT